MKKLLLFAFFGLFIISVNGCKKENTTKQTQETPLIVGKWNYKSDQVNIYTKSKITGGGPYTYTGGEFIQFNKDGSGSDYNTTFTYTVKNNTLTINYAAYILGGSTYDAETVVSQIKELSANKLTLYYDFTFRDSGNLLNGNEVTEYLTK